MLEKQINEDLMSAVKDKNSAKVDALRLIKSNIQLEQTNGSLHELTDEQIIKIIQKLSRQMEETSDMYKNAGKDVMAKLHLDQKVYMDYYLPKMLTEDQLRVIVDDIISHNGFSSIKDMKSIMSILASNYPGQYDGKVAGKIIKEML